MYSSKIQKSAGDIFLILPNKDVMAVRQACLTLLRSFFAIIIVARYGSMRRSFISSSVYSENLLHSSMAVILLIGLLHIRKDVRSRFSMITIASV